MGGVCGISLSPPHTLSPLEVSSRFSKTKHVRCAQRIRRCSIHQTPHRAERLMHILCYWPRRFVYVSLPPFTAISAAGPIPRSHSLLPRARRKPNQQQCVPLARILPIWKLFGHIFSAPTPPSDGSPCGRQFLDAPLEIVFAKPPGASLIGTARSYPDVDPFGKWPSGAAQSGPHHAMDVARS